MNTVQRLFMFAFSSCGAFKNDISIFIFFLGGGGRITTLYHQIHRARNTKGGSITVWLTSCFERFGISCMTTDNFCFLFAKQTNSNQSNKRSMVR